MTPSRRAIAFSHAIINSGGSVLSLSVILNPQALRRVKNLSAGKEDPSAASG